MFVCDNGLDAYNYIGIHYTYIVSGVATKLNFGIRKVMKLFRSELRC